ncbi:PREDICTED: copper homeostasis protein cutC homolog isoform X1 [Condylura cristata]|uniref:copper homeostasis protein cutC homolog isoform X1 n=1 Tax=Condylura cristata TaxID=143302 RepID=UPI000643E096|nr:PREDICTED: copper homeostasis protein cutC homolog isoform X1 [Condylura cristata]
MKRQGASSERKRARISSGMAGAANGFLMEVCVDSVESAVNAERGGAGRIELCSGLLEGGTTPSMGVLQVVKQCVQIPVFVMIRPRGGDFLYSDREVEVMKADIHLAKLYGADGLVFGALTEDGHIDKELCMTLVAICRPLPVTFHRAFDMVHDPVAALETLLTLGFERVLTSGCDSSALEGLPLIKRLIDQAKGRIVVMPGGGITDRNLQRILEGSGATEFHCSARSARDSGMKFRNSSVAMGASLATSEYSLKVTDVTQDSHSLCFMSHMAVENVSKKKRNLKQSYTHLLCLILLAVSIIMVKSGLLLFHRQSVFSGINDELRKFNCKV